MGTQVLGYGSGGTVVLAGELDGRHVAVKRLLARFYDLARKEIDAIIEVDDHPNVVSTRSMYLAVAQITCYWQYRPFSYYITGYPSIYARVRLSSMAAGIPKGAVIQVLLP